MGPNPNEPATGDGHADSADGQSTEGRSLDPRIVEYWDWIAVTLFMFTTVDMITTIYAARVVGRGSEANPLIEWLLRNGSVLFGLVNLLVLGLIVGFFWALMEMLENTPEPYRRYFEVGIELWLGLLLTIGFLIFANNLAVIFFQESLL